MKSKPAATSYTACLAFPLRIADLLAKKKSVYLIGTDVVSLPRRGGFSFPTALATAPYCTLPAGHQPSGARCLARIDTAHAITSGPLTAKQAIFRPANGHFLFCIRLFFLLFRLLAPPPCHSFSGLAAHQLSPSCLPAAIPKSPVDEVFWRSIALCLMPQLSPPARQVAPSPKDSFFFSSLLLPSARQARRPPASPLPSTLIPSLHHHTRAYSAAGPTLLLHSSLLSVTTTLSPNHDTLDKRLGLASLYFLRLSVALSSFLILVSFFLRLQYPRTAHSMGLS